MQTQENTTINEGLSREALPPALRVFWDTAPEQFKVPSVLAALVCYCTLGTRLRAQYRYDLDPHALLLQLLVIGEPGSGKSFTRSIVKQLMRPLKLLDAEQKRIEQDYQDLKKTASKNKQLPEEPITCTRMLQTITRAKLVKRADMFIRRYGEPMSFFFFNEELATMTESNKRAFADLNTMDRLAFDLGAEFGSDTLSDASYNADVDIIYCSLFCGTNNALSEYINKRAIEGGNCTRKIITRIDDDILGNSAPNFRHQTEEESKVVAMAVDQLMRDTYADDGKLQPVQMLDMGFMDEEVESWCNEQRKEVLMSGSKAHDCFYKRASVSAWRIACMCFYLWDKTDECIPLVKTIYRYFASYILKANLAQWGDDYESLQKSGRTKSKKRMTLYQIVPERFSRDQLQEAITQLNLTSHVRIFINKWLAAGLIKEEQGDVYYKMR